MPLTVGKIRFKPGDDGTAVIFDLGAPTLFADLVTEMEEADGVVRVTFAALSKNGDGLHKAIVVARVRMPKVLARQLLKALKGLGP
jgi:hypothetical protein